MKRNLLLIQVLGATLCVPCIAQSNGLPEGFLGRTFYIKNGSETGTAFLIDYKGGEYLITARHVIEGSGASRAKPQVYRSAD